MYDFAMWRSVIASLLVLGCSTKEQAAPPNPSPSIERGEDLQVKAAPLAEPAAPTPAAPTPAASTPKVSNTKCLTTAKKLVKQAKRCSINYRRSPEDICTELFTVDRFSDDDAVKRLTVFLNDGCDKLRLAIENDRV